MAMGNSQGGRRGSLHATADAIKQIIAARLRVASDRYIRCQLHTYFRNQQKKTNENMAADGTRAIKINDKGVDFELIAKREPCGPLIQPGWILIGHDRLIQLDLNNQHSTSINFCFQ